MKTKSKIKIFFPKWIKGRGFVANKIDNSTILINGLLLTCIGLSIASGFVDIVCYSGLSVSLFHLGTLALPAAILYTLISIFLTSGKFWFGMKIGMLKELRTRLKVQNFQWYKNITKALVPWQLLHKLLICISLLTAMSMSVNSIGAGIRAMQQNIGNMTRDAETLIELNKSVNSGVKDNRSAKKDNIMSTKNAQDDAKKEVEKYWTLLDNYQTKIRAIRANEELADEDKDEQIAKIKKEAVNSLPVITSKNVEYISKPEFEREFAKITKSNEIIDSSSVYEEAVAYDKSQIEVTLLAIADKDYKMPDGENIIFLNEDGTPINVQLAISRLQNGISMWQADTGDVGESSKVFTLLAMYIKADETAGGIGAAEWMIMLFIFFTGIIQECMIALCTPSATIDRKTLSSVSRHCEWKDEEEKERFLLKVYKSYVGDGVFSQGDYEEKCRKCVELMEETEEDIIAKYSKHTVKAPKVVKVRAEKPLPNIDKDVSPDYFESDELDELINKTEELIKK